MRSCRSQHPKFGGSATGRIVVQVLPTSRFASQEGSDGIVECRLQEIFGARLITRLSSGGWRPGVQVIARVIDVMRARVYRLLLMTPNWKNWRIQIRVPLSRRT